MFDETFFDDIIINFRKLPQKDSCLNEDYLKKLFEYKLAWKELKTRNLLLIYFS